MDIINVQNIRKPLYKQCIKKYGDLDDSTRELILAAVAIRKFAYAPYSNFKVGAAFRTKCGRIYSGCNVENAAFSPSCCAERNAICKAISEGYSNFIAGAVVAYQDDNFTMPCGVCRQFIMEFSPKDIPLFITKDTNDGDLKGKMDAVFCTSIDNLLPSSFRFYR